jgi:hypothetical protein
MPNLSNPATSASQAAQASIPADAEPDVPWGSGGIDDWGWTSHELTTDKPADRARGRR